MSEWQPIDTAPKDGRLVLLLSAEKPVQCALGYWDPEGTSWVDSLGRLDGDAYTLAVTGFWASDGGWFQPNEVSHWAAVPAPPST